MEFTSLWEDASRDVEAENADRLRATARIAAQPLWPFLSAAWSTEEFEQRLALAEDSVIRAAASVGSSVDSLATDLRSDFGLLMEARKAPQLRHLAVVKVGDNSFYVTDEDSDKDIGGPYDSRDAAEGAINGGDFAESKDELGVEKGSGGDSDDDKDKGDSDDSDDDSASDDDSDDDGDDKDSDSDKDDDGGNPFAKKESSVYARLHQALMDGQDPLEWIEGEVSSSPGTPEVEGGHDDGPVQATGSRLPFDRLATAPGGEDPVDGSNVPMEAQPFGGPQLPDPNQVTTKPRQMPSGGAPNPAMGPGEFDPDMNGSDVGVGADSAPGDESKIAQMTASVRRDNPGLSETQCRDLAVLAYSRYIKEGEYANPLDFGNRSSAPDGPLTKKLKNWSPPNLPTKLPGTEDSKPDSGPEEGPAEPEGPRDNIPPGAPKPQDLSDLDKPSNVIKGPWEGAGNAAGGAAGAGEAAGVGAAAEELAPLLLLAFRQEIGAK